MKRISFLFVLLIFCSVFCSCQSGRGQNNDTATEKSDKTHELALHTAQANDTTYEDKDNTNTDDDKFFEGKDIDIKKLGIDTTQSAINVDTLTERSWDSTINGVKTVIVDGKKIPFEEYANNCLNAIFPLRDYRGFKVFVMFFEYGDSEYWEMCIADKGVVDAKTQKIAIRYTWDDLGNTDSKNADYNVVNFWIYKDYTIRLKGEKRKNGKITKRTRYYRITSDGRFEEIKGKVSK